MPKMQIPKYNDQINPQNYPKPQCDCSNSISYMCKLCSLYMCDCWMMMHPMDHFLVKIDYSPSKTFNLLQKLSSLCSTIEVNPDSEQIINEIDTKLNKIQSAFLSAWKLGQWEVIDEIGDEAAAIKNLITAPWIKRIPLSEIDSNSGKIKKQAEPAAELQQSNDDNDINESLSQEFIQSYECSLNTTAANIVTFQEFVELYEQYTQNKDFGDSQLNDSYLMIDMRKKPVWDWLMFLVNNHWIVPSNIQWLEIANLGDSCEIVKEFMTCCVQNPFETLIINDYHLAKLKNKRLKISEYLKSFSAIISKITKSLHLAYFKIESKELSYLVQKSCHLSESLWFYYWVIDTNSTIHFGNQNYKFNNFSFDNWKIINTEGSEAAFGKISKAIGKSTLKNSLKSITNYGCNVSTELICELLKEQSINKIYIGAS